MTPEERKDWERRLAIMRGQQLASSGPLADPILGRTEGSILQSHGLPPNLGLINQDRDRVVLGYLRKKKGSGHSSSNCSLGSLCKLASHRPN